MDPISQQAVLATAGAAAGGDKVYVDDVFRTYLYTGTNATNQIINGIDFATEGGLLWIKSRAAGSHTLNDTINGAGNYMTSDTISGVFPTHTWSNGVYANYALQSFNNNGFTLGGNFNNENPSGTELVSWSFRKAPGFFDVVTYTGDGNSTKTINHSLGSVPGMIIVKRTSGTGNWITYHRSLGSSSWLRLNSDGPAQGTTNYGNWPWGSTTPTSTQFTVALDGSGSITGDDYKLNISGETYVAYIFAHDDAQFGTGGNESIIKCGSYTGDASTPGPIENLGWEPQWVMIKSSSTGAWLLWDSMRGIIDSGSSNYLLAESTDAEAISTGAWGGLRLTPTGFQVDGNGGWMNASGTTYIYMAIRRPHKPPEVGTDVYVPSIGQTDVSVSGTPANFPVDMLWSNIRPAGNNYAMQRLTGNDVFTLNYSYRPTASSSASFFAYQNNVMGPSYTGSQTVAHMFKRAPGFLDIVAYSGTGSARLQEHNLGVAPELVIVKNRSGQYNMSWHVGPFTPGYSNGYLYFDTDMADGGNQSNYLPSVSSSTFGVTNDNGVNGTGYTYVAYLFATLSGISKVGTYAGNTNNNVDVNCGFSSGARFVMIKNTTNAGDWYVWNSATGIVSGNDPHKFLNDFVAEVTNTDYIDPLTSGFTINSGSGQGLNETGNTYLFLAIA